jgi:hypothetical protein
MAVWLQMGKPGSRFFSTLFLYRVEQTQACRPTGSKKTVRLTKLKVTAWSSAYKATRPLQQKLSTETPTKTQPPQTIEKDLGASI